MGERGGFSYGASVFGFDQGGGIGVVAEDGG